MTINPLAMELAAEHRRDLLQSAMSYRRGRVARRPARAGRLTVRIRPVRPADSGLLADLFARLSPASRRARFLHQKSRLTPAELRYFSEVDHHDHEALIAVTRRGEPVGVARFVRNRTDVASAEVSVAVVDDWQGRGVGSMLTAALTVRALQENVGQFSALAYSDNQRIQRLLAKVGEVRPVARDGATVCYRVTLSATDGRVRRPGLRPWIARHLRTTSSRVRTTGTRAAWRRVRPDHDALVDVAPLLVALMPFAAVIGVQSSADGRAAGSLAGTLLLYAGSAQVSALSLLHEGAGLLSILAAVVLINSRFVAYSAALAPHFSRQPTWFRWLAPHFVIDQTFAVVTARGDLGDPRRFRRYWLTSAAVIALVWVLAMAAGALLGPVLPNAPAIAFMPAAVFVAFIAPSLHDRAGAVAVAVAAAVTLAPLPPGARVLFGVTAGAFAGFITARVVTR